MLHCGAVTNVSAVGKRVRALRVARGMTQKQLADLAGLYHTTISELELGKTLPGIDTLGKIAAVFGVTLHWLFHDGDDHESGT